MSRTRSRRDEAAYRAAEAKLFEAYGVRPREHLVEAPSLGVRVRVLEIGEGEPVLMVHGSPNTAATWIPLAAALQDRRCLLVERPGAGLGEPVRDWGVHRRSVAAMLGHVLDGLGHATADVVGSSFGGLYAYALSLEAPGRVRRLVQMGCPAGTEVVPMPPIFRLLSLPLLPKLVGRGMRPDLAEARKMWREIGHGAAIDRGALPEILFEWYSVLLCSTDTLEHLVGEIGAIATPFGFRAEARVRRDDLAKLAPPTLYLWGDEDNFGTPAHAEQLCAATPGARLERFAGFGHLPWVDDPAGIAARVRAFLGEELRAAG